MFSACSLGNPLKLMAHLHCTLHILCRMLTIVEFIRMQPQVMGLERL